MLVITIVYGRLYLFEDVYDSGLVLSFTYLLTAGMAYGKVSGNLRCTRKGITHKAMWNAFSKFLDDFSKMKDCTVQSLVLWEHYLVYAVALGKAKKVIEQLKVKYPRELAETNINLYTDYAIMSFCRDISTFSTFNSMFCSATNTAFTPPISDSGGGFSCGGGSGGGGGGGGGF